jgi:hypothetical protein
MTRTGKFAIALKQVRRALMDADSVTRRASLAAAGTGPDRTATI